MAGATTDEEYAAWLEREDVAIEDTVSRERLRARLDIMFDETDRFPPTDAQAEALWNAAEDKFKWAEAGIRPFVQSTSIGAPLRFGIRGQAGSFGIDIAREIFELRMGFPPPF